MGWQLVAIPDAQRDGDIRRILERCVAHARLTSAVFVLAHPHKHPHNRNASLSVVACFPSDGPRVPFTRSVAALVRRALDSQRPQVVISRTEGGGVPAGDAQVVMVVPVASKHLRLDSVILASGSAPDSSSKILDFLQEEAGRLAELLATDGRLSTSLAVRATAHRGYPAHTGLPMPPTRDALVHELRAPLSAARFALESLGHMSRGERATSPTDVLRTALLGVAEAQSIVRWFSQLRDIEHGGFQLNLVPVAVAEVIQRARALLPGTAERIFVRIADEVGPVVADPLWLTQALTNLFENAVKHAHAFDLIRVDVRTMAHDRTIISVRTPGGPENAEASQTLLQRPLRRERADDLTSRGIGLALVQFFITEMGGEFWVEADAHDSTTIVLSLPVAQ
jgi:signal transduction histidine kinase